MPLSLHACMAVLGYRLPRNISGDASSVQAMDHAPLDPATAEAMNALYEADHPKFQSRMPGVCLAQHC